MKKIVCILTAVFVVSICCSCMNGNNKNLNTAENSTEEQTTANRDFTGLELEAYNIANTYSIENYGDDFSDFEIGFDLKDDVWEVYYYKIDVFGGGAPSMKIDPETKEVIWCMLQE